ncbi:MAG: hypothetical protein JSV81_05800, partial [Anaerolineales bacterium]
MGQRRLHIKLLLLLIITTLIGSMGAWPVLANRPEPVPAKPTAGSVVPDVQAPRAEYVPGDVLVKFKPALGQRGAQDLLAAQGLQVAGAIQAIGVLKLAVKP